MWRQEEFSGGLVVRIPGFHCQGPMGFHCHGPGSIHGWGTEILQAMRYGKKKKKKKRENKSHSQVKDRGLRRNQHCQHLELRILASRIVREWILLFKPPTSWNLVITALAISLSLSLIQLSYLWNDGNKAYIREDGENWSCYMMVPLLSCRAAHPLQLQIGSILTPVGIFQNQMSPFTSPRAFLQRFSFPVLLTSPQTCGFNPWKLSSLPLCFNP